MSSGTPVQRRKLGVCMAKRKQKMKRLDHGGYSLVELMAFFLLHRYLHAVVLSPSDLIRICSVGKSIDLHFSISGILEGKGEISTVIRVFSHIQIERAVRIIRLFHYISDFFCHLTLIEFSGKTMFCFTNFKRFRDPMSLFIEHCAPRAIYVTIINSNAHRSQDHL